MADHPRPTRSTQPIPHQLPPEEDSLAQAGEPVEERSRFANFDAEDGNEWQDESQPTTSPTDVPKFLQTHEATSYGWRPLSKRLEHEGSVFEDVPTQAMEQPALPPVSETNADGATIFSSAVKQFLAALIAHHQAYESAAREQLKAAQSGLTAASQAIVYHEQQIADLIEQWKRA